METSNSIQIISIPRSGQHLFERLLGKIHSYYNIPFSYCEYYSCCQSIPCKKGAIYLKNHDFSLKIKKHSTKKYIVLYRKDSVLQMESIFRFKKKNVNYENNKDFYELIEHYRDTISYYYGFILKWVKSPKPNILLIEYNSFCENPTVILNKILIFLDFRDPQLTDSYRILNEFEKIESKSIKNSIYLKIKEEIAKDSYLKKLFKIISKIRLNKISYWNIRLLINYVCAKY